jgi:hypothetical protein
MTKVWVFYAMLCMPDCVDGQQLYIHSWNNAIIAFETKDDCLMYRDWWRFEYFPDWHFGQSECYEMEIE